MTFSGVNYLAVLVAAIVAFVFGAVWYNILGRQWLLAQGKTVEAGQPRGKPPLVQMVVTFVAQLVMAYVLAAIAGHLGNDQDTIVNGLHAGLFAWLGFIATSLIVNDQFEGQKLSLTVINGGHWLGVLLIQGAIIGAFGR